MAGTVEGQIKARQTLIAQYGSEEAYREAMREKGRRGGLAKVPKGFAMMSKEKRSAAGKKGGAISKRPPAKAE